MTGETIEIRSQAAQGRDNREPDRPHCGRCGNESIAATLVLMPLAATVEDPSYSTMTCEVCTQRVVDLLINPHLFLTAVTTDDETMMAELMIDGTGISRMDAISMLINAAEMLNTGDAESVIHYDQNEDQS
jgi:hypothetical protein